MVADLADQLVSPVRRQRRSGRLQAAQVVID
jgi:hypothetical protein